MDLYRQRIESRQDSAADHTSGRRSDIIERDLRLAALKAERAEIFRRVRRRQLGTEIARKLVRELDLLEARYAGYAWRWFCLIADNRPLLPRIPKLGPMQPKLCLTELSDRKSTRLNSSH